MGSFDYFVGPLECDACGHICDDSRSNLQSKLQIKPTLSELSVGDNLVVEWSDIGSAGYLEITPPAQPNTVSLLETWECPNCDRAFRWARIEIIDGRYASMRAVTLSPDIVRNANYISVECKYLVDAPLAPSKIVAALIASLESI